MVKFADTLWLFTQEEFDQLPLWTTLISINGNTHTKGIDNFDYDTRYGCIAYGVRDPNNHPLAELFLTFRLRN
jgi:hypothetical protein